MHQITDRLYVGNINDATQPPVQISAVLLVAEEFSIQPPDWLAYGRIPMREFAEADAKILARAVGWVEQHLKDNRVMVCCRAGMGRSVSVVMAYLCCVENMAYADVLKLVKTRRPGAMPLPMLEQAVEAVRRFRRVSCASHQDPPAQAAAG
jgi:protein-tyrosine phosphatase